MKIVGKILLAGLLLIFGMLTLGAGACALAGIREGAALFALGAFFCLVFGAISWVLLKVLWGPDKAEGSDEQTPS